MVRAGDLFPMYVMAETGYEVLSEHKFHLTRKWRLDYFIPRLRLAIEKEGGVFVKSRHTSPVGYSNDMEKYNAVCCAGLYLLRYRPKDMLTAQVIKDIKEIERRRNEERSNCILGVDIQREQPPDKGERV